MIPILKNRLEEIQNKFLEIESKLLDTSIDSEQRLSLSKEHAELSPIVESINNMNVCMKEIDDVNEILNEKNLDNSIKQEAIKELNNLKKSLNIISDKTQKLLIPKDPDDNRDAIIEIRAGTGGDEAALFGSKLFRMYIRFAEIQNWQIEILSLSENDIGGTKEASAKISGNNVFGKLKFESGVHRVQRIPTTETQGRIHTSAATVAILPVVKEVSPMPWMPVNKVPPVPPPTDPDEACDAPLVPPCFCLAARIGCLTGAGIGAGAGAGLGPPPHIKTDNNSSIC